MFQAVNGVDSDYGPYDPTQEPIFPSELQVGTEIWAPFQYKDSLSRYGVSHVE